MCCVKKYGRQQPIRFQQVPDNLIMNQRWNDSVMWPTYLWRKCLDLTIAALEALLLNSLCLNREKQRLEKRLEKKTRHGSVCVYNKGHAELQFSTPAGKSEISNHIQSD